jgi:glyoxylase-like metal-dependent hydrolase (beta-lactamase superfamily II)
MVVGVDVETRPGQLFPDVLVPPAVLPEAVDEKHGGPRRTRRRIRGPMPGGQDESVGGTRGGEGGRHARSVRRYDPWMSRWRELGDRVFVRRYPFFNQSIGVVLGDGGAVDPGVLIIDTRTTPRHAREIRVDLEELTRGPVSVVVNTHGHSDHSFGNSVFRPAKIWGHVRCATMLTATGERQRASLIEAFPDMAADIRSVVIDPPDRTFEDRVTLSLAGRPVELRYLGRGHTDNDIVVTPSGAAVIFAGDLLENGATPFFGDGYPLDWPPTVEALLGLIDDVVVPGHGSHAGREFVAAQLEEFRALADLASRVQRGEFAVEDAVAASPYPPADSRQPLERALAQLRGELA